MFWCLVRLSTGALYGGLYANPLEMAIQSAVACSEAKDGGLLVLWQLMERVLVWVVSSSLAVEDGFLFIMDKSFDFSIDNCIQRRSSRFFTISSLRRELSPARTLNWPRHYRVKITCNTSSAYHMQCVVCHLVRRDSSAIKFDRVEIAFILALLYGLETIKKNR